jgi:Fe2+ transport system protein B
VANYAGVTVERKEGWLSTPGKRRVRVLDLPGTYSLDAHSEDERITRDIVKGQHPREAPPELLVCVTDATHLRLNLRLVLEARALGLPMVVVLNMSDMARRQGWSSTRPSSASCWACPWWRAWACICPAPRICWPGWTAIRPGSSRLRRSKASSSP